MPLPDLALHTPQETTDLEHLGDLWQAADDLGFRAAFTFDHLVPLHPGERPGSIHHGLRRGHQLDGWMTAAVLAMRTRSLQVGTLVSSVTYRSTIDLAKLAITLDHATGGRAILGLGAGWLREEHEMFGLPFPRATDRLARLEETLVAFHLLCRQQVTTFHGRHVNLQDAIFEPKPVRASGLPILVGGNGKRTLELAGRYANMYNCFASPSEWSAVHARLDEVSREVDREPSSLERTAFVRADLSGDPMRSHALIAEVARTRGEPPEEAARRVLAGPQERLTRQLTAYGEAGVSLVVVSAGPDVTTDNLARLAQARSDAAVPSGSVMTAAS